MGMLTFSVLKNIKLKLLLHKLHKTFTTEVGSQTQAVTERITGDPSYIEILPSWGLEEEGNLRAEVLDQMRVLPGFVSEAEEAALLTDVEPQLRRMRYEYDHWDNAIEGYRETERDSWSPASAAVMSRVHRVFPATAALLPRAHVLDLAAAGHIKPHVDAVRIKQWCADAGNGVTYAFDYRDSYVAPTKVDNTNPYWVAFKGALDELNIPINVRRLPATSDAQGIRQQGTGALGFSPLRHMRPSVHEHDESIPASVFLEAVSVYEKVLPAVANA